MLINDTIRLGPEAYESSSGALCQRFRVQGLGFRVPMSTNEP